MQTYTVMVEHPTQGFPPRAYITGGHIWVPLGTVESQEVACAVHDPQSHTDLVRLLAIDGQLDVAGHSQSVVHAQHPLIDIHCSLLKVEGLNTREEGAGGEGWEKATEGLPLRSTQLVSLLAAAVSQS